jgi:type VI secretion system protein ImpL
VNFKEWEASAPPLAMRYGMFQGNTLYGPLRRFYIQQIQRELVDPIIKADQDEMRSLRQVYGQDARPTDQEYKRFFDKLKVHLLLTSPHEPGELPLEGPEREWIIDALASRWAMALTTPLNPEMRAQMADTLQFYLDLLARNPDMAIGRDVAAVRDTRNLLNRVSFAEANVKRVIVDADAEDHDLNIRRIMAGGVTPIVSDRSMRVRAAYTRWGWENVVRAGLAAAADQRDRWVFGAEATGNAARDRFLAEIRSVYFTQYLDEWSAFLGSLRIKQPADVQEALTQLTDMTRGQPPPLKRLTETVAMNAILEDEKSLAAGAAEKAAGKSQGLIASLKKSLGSDAADLATKTVSLVDVQKYAGLIEARAVREGLADFYRFGFVPPPAGADDKAKPEATPLDTVQALMVELRDALAVYVSDRSQGAKVLQELQTTRTALTGIFTALEVTPVWRTRLEALVMPPFDSVKETLVDIRSETGGKWCSAVMGPYARSIAGRYPFSNAGRDATVSDVGEFFRPKNGSIWAFYGSDLAADVKQSGSVFQFDSRSGGMVARAYSDALLPYLKRAYRVTNSLFPPGSPQPKFEFDVKLLPSPDFGVIGMDVGTKALEYRGGPESFKRASWPGEDASQGAAIRVKGRGGIEDSVRFSGEWGLFRLLEAGIVVSASGGSYEIRWPLPRLGSTVSVEFRPASTATDLFSVVQTPKGRRLKLDLGDTSPPPVIARGSASCAP